MFPTLGHLINYLFGTSINFPMPTYGFLLVLAFLTGGIILKFSLKRKEKEGSIASHKSEILISGPINYVDLCISTLFNFVLGFKIFGVIMNYDLFTKDINDYLFSTQGNWFGGIILAIIGAGYGYWTAKKAATPEAVYETKDVLPSEITLNIVMVAMISGIIGAKVFDILENFSRFLNDPLESLFSTGGFTFYGGLIVGILSVWYYIRKKNIPSLQLMDAGAPAILGAYAVGRMACMLSGDGCWGVPNIDPKPEWLAFAPDWLWSFDFPNNVMNEGSIISDCSGKYCHQLDTPVYPTPLYESLLSIVFFLFVWFIQNKIKTPGVIIFMTLMLNGLARFFIEKIRVNNVYDIASSQITQAEIISSSLVIIGIVGIIAMIIIHKPKK